MVRNEEPNPIVLCGDWTEADRAVLERAIARTGAELAVVDADDGAVRAERREATVAWTLGGRRWTAGPVPAAGAVVEAIGLRLTLAGPEPGDPVEIVDLATDMALADGNADAGDVDDVRPLATPAGLADGGTALGAFLVAAYGRRMPQEALETKARELAGAAAAAAAGTTGTATGAPQRFDLDRIGDYGTAMNESHPLRERTWRRTRERPWAAVWEPGSVTSGWLRWLEEDERIEIGVGERTTTVLAWAKQIGHTGPEERGVQLLTEAEMVHVLEDNKAAGIDAVCRGYVPAAARAATED